MFKKLFLKFLNGLSPEEKAEVRGLLENDGADLEETETAEETEKVEKTEETKVDENGENSKDTTDKETTETETNKVEENKEDKVAENSNEETEKEETAEQTTEPANETTEQEEIHEIALGDIVTKQFLNEVLEGINSKVGAIVKENDDLKDKFLNNDFGGMKNNAKVEKANEVETFDSYSAQFD